MATYPQNGKVTEQIPVREKGKELEGSVQLGTVILMPRTLCARPVSAIGCISLRRQCERRGSPLFLCSSLVFWPTAILSVA